MLNHNSALIAATILLSLVASCSKPPPENGNLVSLADAKLEFLMLTLDATNKGERAIETIHFTIKYHRPGREVPFGEIKTIASIPGGIEPGETVKVSAEFSVNDDLNLEYTAERGMYISEGKKVSVTATFVEGRGWSESIETDWADVDCSPAMDAVNNRTGQLDAILNSRQPNGGLQRSMPLDEFLKQHERPPPEGKDQ